MNFNTILVSEVESQVENGTWKENYTHKDSQKSDDGLYMWVVGEHDNVIESFDTYTELMTYCYANGWTENEVDEDEFI